MQAALGSGQLRDGDPFPSVRQLTQELRISPSAAQKAVSQLREAGLLALQTGSGFMVRLESPHSLKASIATFPTQIASPSHPDLGSTLPFLTRAGGETDFDALDSYEIRRLIARGGMGIVFEALRSHPATPGGDQDPRAAALGLREGPRAVPPGRRAPLPPSTTKMCCRSTPWASARAFPYLVMPLVRGASLQSKLAEEGALPVEDVISLAIKIARGLAAAPRPGAHSPRYQAG